MRWKAVLLVGLTGSGKTPLGGLLEKEGMLGRKCQHFDFGEELRKAADQQTGQLTLDEFDVVVKSLKTGTLLKNQHFSIAKKLLTNSLNKRNISKDTLVILNGLPRHVGQAKAIGDVVDVRALVSLECEPLVVWERIRMNTGGDRRGRDDDTSEKIGRRFEIFRKETVPLFNYYLELGVPVVHLDVGVSTTAQEMYLHLEGKLSQIVL